MMDWSKLSDPEHSRQLMQDALDRGLCLDQVIAESIGGPESADQVRAFVQQMAGMANQFNFDFLGEQLDAAERAAGVSPGDGIFGEGSERPVAPPFFGPPVTAVGHDRKVSFTGTQHGVPVVDTATVIVVGDNVIVTHNTEDIHGALQVLLLGAQELTNQLSENKHEESLQGGGIFSAPEPA